jgi:hypothetical protein
VAFIAISLNFGLRAVPNLAVVAMVNYSAIPHTNQPKPFEACPNRNISLGIISNQTTRSAGDGSSQNNTQQFSASNASVQWSQSAAGSNSSGLLGNNSYAAGASTNDGGSGGAQGGKSGKDSAARKREVYLTSSQFLDNEVAGSLIHQIIYICFDQEG